MIEVNFLAVIVAALVSMAIGFYWYSSYGFGKKWMKLSGISPQEQKEKGKGKQDMTRSVILGFAATIVTALILSHFSSVFGVAGITDALTLAIGIWLGFQAPIMLNTVIWEQKPWKLYAINAGYQLVSIVVMAVIIGLWV